MTHDNGVAMAGLQGNQIAQGALGGNATGVAKGILAGQQGRTMASTDASLYDRGYQGALNTAYQQYQQNPLAAGNALANYGISGQNALLSGAGQQINAGSLQQQTEQQRLNALYQQYQQAQAYPYQQTQWLAGIDTGVGSNLGGTGTGQTTGPPPNQTAQWLGTGIAAAGLFLNQGGRVHRYSGGGVAQPFMRMADGGVPSQPWSGGVGWIPQMNIHGGSGAPHPSAPSLPQAPTFDPSKLASGISGLGNKWNLGRQDKADDLAADLADGSAYYDTTPVTSGMAGLGGVYFRGGGVHGYAGGGAPMIEDGGFNSLDADADADANRATGYALLRKGQGTRSLGDAGVINPNDPVRMPDQAAVDAWRSGTPAMPAGAAPVEAKDDDEDELPPAATPTQGGPQGVAGAAYKPPYQITAEDYAPAGRGGDDRSSFGLGLISPNAKSGLLAAGLGMLASRSPFLGNAVGEGGMAGFSAYGTAEERDRKVAEEARKLSLEAKKAANVDARATFTANETSRHNKATEATAAKNLDRTKFVPAGQYMGEDGVYRPVVMDQSTGRLVDPATGKAISGDAKVRGKGDKDTGFTDDEAKDIARRFVVSGDVTDLQGIGPAARLKVTRAIKQVQKDLNVSDEELAQRKVEFAGRKAGSRTLGTMEAKMGSAAFEAEGAIKLVRGVIEKLPRTAFLPFNQLAEAFSKKTLNPDQAELYARAQAIVNTYSAVMSRGANVVTDSARHHAGELLNTAYDATTFNRVLDTMLNEIEMAKASPARMQEFYRKHYGPKSVEQGNGSAGGPGVSPPAAGSFAPPAGALARTDKAGKVWYYDPASKQPYPGQ